MQPQRGSAPEAPSLKPDEIHLWWVRLDPGPQTVERHLGLLDAGEQDRAGRFRFERHRTRYIVSHGALRELLGRYLGVTPNDVRFEFGERDKPHLSREHRSDLHFNLTHSRHRAIIGLRKEGQLGVDLEQVRPMRDLLSLAESVFSPPELQELQAADAERRPDTFFVFWTRKEALLKATGEGIATDLKQVDVLPRNKASEHFETVRGRDGISVATLRPRAGWVAAVAIAGPESRLLNFDFDG